MLSDHPATPAGLDRKNLLWGLVVGVVTAVLFGLGGFALVRDDNGTMGGVLFLFLPTITGFATALVAKRRNIVFASLVLGLIFCSAILLATGAEGWVCVLMSSPLIAAGLTLGALLGWLVRKLVIDRSNHAGALTLLALLVLPLFLMGANSAERDSRRTLRTETITDTLTTGSSPEIVWKQLENMENVTATRTFLMKIGLPVPVSCKMEGEGVGAKRTCYFEQGFIEERVTEWNFPASMKFDIVASNIPGRPWLGFKDAAYEIRRESDRTVITRQTTIVSRLSPAWYWRRLEAYGVHTEHNYLFEGLENNLNKSK